MVIDERRTKNQAVAIVLYSTGGHLVFWIHEPLKEADGLANVLVTGEKFVGETLTATRHKEYRCEVIR